MQDALGNVDDMDDNLVVSNVYYDSFHKMVNYYKGNKEVWEEQLTITLIDTPPEIGLFGHSDIILKYDPDSMLPTVIAERLYRKYYNWRGWHRLCKHLRQKRDIIQYELGYTIDISIQPKYIDYIHYKEDWLKWAVQSERTNVFAH